MAIQDTVVLDGEMQLLLDNAASCELLVPESGEVGVFTAIREAYPAYTGSYEITPSSEVQILETALKTTTDRIVINPVPQNYGLITWNGSTITVS